MKKPLLFASIFLLTWSCFSQTIDNITVIPSNPTESDDITLLVDLTFFSGACDDHTQSFSIMDTAIGAYALHCIGSLTVICNYTDTFHVGQLNAGIYTFQFQLDEGQAPSPCTPGIIPGPNASLTFEVSGGTPVEDPSSNNLISVFPNPADDNVHIMLYDGVSEEAIISLSSMDGKLILDTPANKEILIQTAFLSDGIYVLELRTGSTCERKLLVVQH